MRDNTVTKIEPIYCGYSLYCKKCGHKAAVWTVDTPATPEHVQELFAKQLRYVTWRTHKDHGGYTILSRLDSGNKREYDEWAKQVSDDSAILTI